MKIRVTLMLLLCTTFVTNSKNTIGPHWPSSTKFPDRKELAKLSEPRHRIHEYSRSIEAVSTEFRNENVGSQRQTTKALHHFQRANAEDTPNKLARSLEGPEGSLQILDTVKKSEQSSRNAEHDSSHRNEKVLSRKKKSKLSQAILPLLLAYKLKFAALIPVLLGGMSLLVSTTTLAGFFFALFAAVLGLKAH